mmetsp:Transcript_25581/g.46797  ORF Transcript_25581/g.46797 Transcript_25581/m.46797 type:complete len:210 (-) Transcript_25581:126-755(-)
MASGGPGYAALAMDRTKYTLGTSEESMVRTPIQDPRRGLPAVGFGATKAKLMQAAFRDDETVVVHAGSASRSEPHLLVSEGVESHTGDALDLREDVKNVLLIVEAKGGGVGLAQRYMRALLGRKQRNPALTCVVEPSKGSRDPAAIAAILEALHSAGATQVQLGTFWSSEGKWSCPLPGRRAESEAIEEDLSESLVLPQLQADESLLLA